MAHLAHQKLKIIGIINGSIMNQSEFIHNAKWNDVSTVSKWLTVPYITEITDSDVVVNEHTKCPSILI